MFRESSFIFQKHATEHTLRRLYIVFIYLVICRNLFINLLNQKSYTDVLTSFSSSHSSSFFSLNLGNDKQRRSLSKLNNFLLSNNDFQVKIKNHKTIPHTILNMSNILNNQQGWEYLKFEKFLSPNLKTTCTN